MTDTPVKLVVNCETGVQEYIPFTAEEIAQAEADRLAWEQEKAAQEQAQAEKEALEASAVSKLAALGLTPDEIAALKS